MLKKKKSSSSNNQQLLMKYGGLSAKLLAGIGIAVFAGLKADRWPGTLPLLSCVLPLLVMFAIFYRLFRETTNLMR
jgi:F0F1-type ATP synthase assembly protein I